MKHIVLLLIGVLFSFVADAACPACPPNSSTAGSGESTNLIGCKCNDSSFGWDGTSCVVRTCNGQGMSWGNCTGSVSTLSHGQSANITNTRAGYTGNATYSCNNGSWSLGANACNIIATCSVGSGTPNGGAACSLPEGGTIQSGCGKSYYLYASVSTCSGMCSTCAVESDYRTCNNGVLDGSATRTTCNNTCVCFVAGTQVTMKDGSTKNIEDITLGETVRTYDEGLKKFTESPVVKAIHHKERHQALYEFTFDDGVQLTSTENHPYFVKEISSYLTAAEVYQRFAFNQSVHMLREDGSDVGISRVHIYEQTVKVYNLHVQSPYDKDGIEGKDGHNYFANGVLVHNKPSSAVCY